MDISKKITICFLLLLSIGCSSTTYVDDYKEGILLTREMISRYGEYNDAPRYVTYIRMRITKGIPHNDRTNYKIVILNTDTPLAYSPGGGFVLVSRGMIKQCANEAEFAFVLLHEIAHKMLGHTAIKRDSGYKFSKDLELEADKKAVGLLAAADYDPRAAISALMNTYAYSITESASHPEINERIDAIRRTIQDSNWQPPGTIDRRGFRVFKSYL